MYKYKSYIYTIKLIKQVLTIRSEPQRDNRGIKKMKDHNGYDIEAHQVNALYAYLELCNALNEVPRKEVYDKIKNCKDTAIIEEATCLIELEHGNFEKAQKAQIENTKKSTLSNFLNIFKK